MSSSILIYASTVVPYVGTESTLPAALLFQQYTRCQGPQAGIGYLPTRLRRSAEPGANIFHS